jgi:predicted RNA-binding Zn-ribbon protein involved in translation (DUF1610 family)
MERKYRQRGYMDSDRERERPEKRTAPRKEQFGPKTPVMPGKREVLRCASCAMVLPVGIDLQGRCPKCGFELHSCKQCAFFDTAARFECTQPITARILKKDAQNDCNFYLPRTTIERETSTSKPLDARQAFENLFRK